MRNTAFHFKALIAQKLIKPCRQDINTLYSGMYRTQYFELTEKAREALEAPNPATFSISSPHHQHQYGLQIVMSSLYKIFEDKSVFIDYKNEDYFSEDYKYHPDAVMEVDGKRYIIEFERSRGLNELANEMIKRDKKINNATFIYVICATFSKNKSSTNDYTVKPTEIYDRINPLEKRVESFVTALMPLIKDLPSHKYYIACLHEFDKFNQGIWRKPGKRETFKIA